MTSGAEGAILRAGLTLMRRLQHKVDLHKKEHTLYSDPEKKYRIENSDMKMGENCQWRSCEAQGAQ